MDERGDSKKGEVVGCLLPRLCNWPLPAQDFSLSQGVGLEPPSTQPCLEGHIRTRHPTFSPPTAARRPPPNRFLGNQRAEADTKCSVDQEVHSPHPSTLAKTFHQSH